MLGRLAITAIVVTLPLLFNSQSADAAWGRLATKEGVHGGYCPMGTCSKAGTQRARDVTKCRKENCPKGYKDAPR
jgi:hypothetical protein